MGELIGKKSTVFGPVPSRRLGLSLGVDIIPYKTCPLDCIYCQLGGTRDKTIARRAYIPPEKVLADLKAALEKAGRIDWITFSGSGEPTLHSGIGEMIKRVKELTDIPVAVLTSGVLLGDESVRRDLLSADLVVPDLDAGTEETFRKVNRPHPDLRLEGVIEGMAGFVSSFHGRVWLEVALVKGINDAPSELKLIGAHAARIGPERIQLNTVIRPPAYSNASALAAGEMQVARDVLRESARGIPIEIIGVFEGKRDNPAGSGLQGKILAFLERRPGTLADLSAGTGASEYEVARILDRLVSLDNVRMGRHGDERYYSINK